MEFFMIYVEGRYSPKVKHFYFEEAVAEAERLARLHENLGKEVYLLKAFQFCKIEPTPIAWTFITPQ